MFKFANPQALFLYILLLIIVVIFFMAQHKRKKALLRYGTPELLGTLMPEVSSFRPALKFWISFTALCFMVLLLARPQFGTKMETVTRKGIETIIALDISNSMLAEDVAPNRLEKSKNIISKLVDGFVDDKIGLIVFAGEAFVQLPITNDFISAKMFLESINPDLIVRQGTNIKAAIDMATRSFTPNEGVGKAIIIITDGENHEDDAIAVAERAAEMGIRIYTIGIGTPEGAPIRIGGDFIRDAEGEMVVSKLNEEMLQQIAELTDGLYVRSSLQSIGLEEIVQSIEAMEKTELSTVRFEEYNEQYPLLVAIALVLLLIEFLLLDRRNPLLRHLNIFRE